MRFDDAQRIARLALARFGVEEAARIEFVKYRENHVFRVHLDDGRSLALRLHRPGYRDADEVRTELSYMRALRKAGVPVPDVVPTTDGELFAHVVAGGHGCLVSVQRWIDDAAPFGDVEAALSGAHAPSPDSFERIGEVLGRLHAAAQTIGVPEGFRRTAWDADGLAGQHPLWGDPTALPSLTDAERAAVEHGRAHVHARLSALSREPGVFGVVHADATPENVMETPDGIALIDFDDFGTGWYVFDLVTAVFHHARNPRYPEYEQALRAGYGSVRTLSAQDLDAWDDFMLARGLTYLGWAAERRGDPAAEFIEDVVAPWVAEIGHSLSTGRPAPWRVGDATPSAAKETP